MTDEKKGGRRLRFERGRGLARFATMGLELAGAVVGLTLLGLWVDYSFDSAPIATLVGAALGIIGGLYNFIRESLELSREMSRRAGRPRKQSNHDDGPSQ